VNERDNGEVELCSDRDDLPVDMWGELCVIVTGSSITIIEAAVLSNDLPPLSATPRMRVE